MDVEDYEPTIEDYIWLSCISLFLVCFAGLMSGLTVGMLSIDSLSLELKTRNGTEYERQAAAKVLPIIHNHHLLMVSLLLSNAAAMEALPIFLHQRFSEFESICISAVLILFLAEILPLAITTGPN